MNLQLPNCSCYLDLYMGITSAYFGLGWGQRVEFIDNDTNSLSTMLTFISSMLIFGDFSDLRFERIYYCRNSRQQVLCMELGNIYILTTKES